MRSRFHAALVVLLTFIALLILHLPQLRLPYYWDEAGYYVPAAFDFYRSGLLIPTSTLPSGHTPLVMIYLGLAWRLFGYSAWVARAGMTLIAAATVTSLYVLGRRVASREIAIWSALLLALSPLFFAQSTLVHLDLAAALFTTLAALFLLGDRFWLFALAASLAILSKETAVVLLPVAWLYVWRRGSRAGRPTLFTHGAPLVAPLLPLAGWAFYYHHATGYWIGNREYLSYNLYSTLSPVRIFWSLLRRIHELLIGGFNGLVTTCAMLGLWWGRRYGTRNAGEVRNSKLETRNSKSVASFESRSPSREPRISSPGPRFEDEPLWGRFIFLAAGLIAIYLLLLSVVGGAILSRYLLPVVPMFYLATVGMMTRLPRTTHRLILTVVAACFVWAWYINPPYPFPYEDNLAYADFIRLHEAAARDLEAQPGQPRILTAWPATNELTQPFLGYVHKPLRIVQVEGFATKDFTNVPPESFDLLYLYSRRWEPSGNWVARFPAWLRMQQRYFDYQPQVAPQALAARFHLRLLSQMERRGQWVQIYAH